MVAALTDTMSFSLVRQVHRRAEAEKEGFHFFEELAQIPRCSGNEKQASDYLVGFAKQRKLEVSQDQALNAIIKKPGTAGYEDSPAVIIQGHMDMVGEKSKGSRHDFSKDPVPLKIDGDFVRAGGTTLGADNGIAVAYGLATLDSADIPHPPLELAELFWSLRSIP